MCNKLTHPVYFIGEIMKQIDNLIQQIKTIMQVNGISQRFVIASAEGRCSRSTILNFFKGDGDCKMSTFLLVLEIIGAKLHIETEMSKEALMAGDISEYRAKIDLLSEQLSEVSSARDTLQIRYNELIDKNTALTRTLEKQQEQIDRYIERMDRAEQNIERKDKRIVELSQRLNIW